MHGIIGKDQVVPPGCGVLPHEGLSALLDAVSDGFYLLDATWRFSYLNGPALDYFRRPASELLGKVIWEVFPEAIGSRFDVEYHGVARDRQPRRFTTVSAVNPSRWMEMRVYPLDTGVAVYFLDVTERVRAQSALRSNEEQLRLIVDSSPALISYVGPNLRYRLVNEAYERWFGVSKADIVGRLMRDVLGDEAWMTIAPHMERALRGEVVAYEAEAHYKEGGTRWIRATYTPERDLDGVVCGVMIFVVDITDVKRAELNLAQSEAYHRAIFDSAGVGNAEVDLRTGRFLRVNQRYCELVGWSQEELLSGMSLSDVTHPDDKRDDSSRIAAENYDEQPRFDAEMRYRRRDGSSCWIHVTRSVVRSPDGQPLSLLIVAQDISERKRAELDRQRFVSLAENSTEFVGMCDQHGIPFFVNEAGMRLVGLDNLEQAIQTPVREFFFPEDQDFIVNEFFPRVLRDGKGEVEIRFRHFRTGEALWMIYNVFIVRDVDGNVVGLATVSRDITQRKHAEQLLMEADRRKDEFLATLAHELRNPLTPISNALQIWPLVEKSPEQAARTRAMMERQVKQLKNLIDDLLDVSRISRGKIELRRERLDVASVIEGAVETVRPIVDAGEHTLTLELPEQPIYVDGDAGRLNQVFGNLLHNAAKYTDTHGQIRVRVGIDDDQVVVRIRDTGAGIPKAMLRSIFEPFVQVNHNLDRTQGGLGIGLTLVKSLVSLHGGNVEAYSEGVGRGSEFVVRLPAAHVAKAPTERGLCDGDVLRHKPAASLRFLVVDDLKASADTLALMFESLGQQVRVAYSGASALEMAHEYHPHVIVSDIAMPGMDGYRLAQLLRTELKEQPTLVALTGYGQEHDRRRAIEAGFDHHLVKPATLSTLQQLLDGIVAHSIGALPMAV